MRRTAYCFGYRLLAGLLIAIMLLGSVGEVSYAAEIVDNGVQEIEEVYEQEEESVSQSEDVTNPEESGAVTSTDEKLDTDENLDASLQETEAQEENPEEEGTPESEDSEVVNPEDESAPESDENVNPEEESVPESDENVNPEDEIVNRDETSEDVSASSDETQEEPEEESGLDESISEEANAIDINTDAEKTESTEAEEIMMATVDLSDFILQEGGFPTEESVLTDSPVVFFASEQSNVTAEISARLLNAYENYVTEVDLSSYEITADEFTPIITDVFNSSPRLFYVKGEYTPYVNTSTGYIVKVVLSYYYDKSTAEQMQSDFDSAIALALSGVNSNWSDLEKTLYLNEYLARNCQYDYDYEKYTAYNALVDRMCVCQGYALAYSLLAEEMGLNCEVVSSRSLNHAWNMVEVNDNYYNVDVTWNDPMPNLPGQSKHIFFMKSTAHYESGDVKHCSEQDWQVTGGWEADYASATNYDTYFWDSLTTGFDYINGYWYAFDGDDEIVKYTCNGTGLSKSGTVLTITDIWYVSETHVALNKSVGTGSYGGLLYYSTDDEIYIYDPATGETKRIYVLPEEYKVDGPIYGIGVHSNGDIYLYQRNVAESRIGIKKVTELVQDETLYHIQFDGNGATDGTMSKLYNKVYDTVYTLPQNGFTRKGYTFTGWNTKADGSGASYANKAEVKNLSTVNGATVTLYAQWEIIKYSIVYDLFNGTNHSDNPSTYTVTSATITLKDPTRYGYTFVAWYDDGYAYTHKITTIPKGSTGIKRIYAGWTPNKYTIKYDGNGATSGTMEDQTGLKYDTEYNLTANTYQRRGYKFVGWKKEADGSGIRSYADGDSVKNLSAVNGDTIILYAQWEKVKYKITYNLNGGTNGSNPSTYYVTSATVKLKNPTRTGCTFAGWYSDSACTKKVTTIPKGSIGNKTLYAKWFINKYNIQFDGNGATSGKMSNQTGLRYNTTYTLTANAYKRKGYSFTGWNTKADGSRTTYKNKAQVKNVTTTNGKTVILYAQWKKVKYTITYNLNGGTNGNNPSAYNVTSATITLKNPTKKGYTFAGWYSDSKCTKKVTTIPKGSTGNKTLYAKWNVNKYNIQFNGNGATSGKMSNKTGLRYDTAYALTSNAYKRTGYVFTGWNTKKDGSGKVYTNKAQVKNLTATNGKTVILYAQWSLPYINATSKTLYVGKTYTLKLVGTTIQSVTTSDSTVARVSKAGVVTAKKPGKTTITLKGANGKSYKCVVTVKE